uniref:Uncharacterized protein n=1 Tax=Anguilla anguilla TaxID=7936 RepID=A0A0E9XU87_ANGAN
MKKIQPCCLLPKLHSTVIAVIMIVA